MLEIPQDPDLIQGDMTPLLQEALTKDTDKVTFRQGTVLEWDAVSSRNKVRYLGMEIENMPVLNSGTTMVLLAGDNVGIISTGKNVFIVGKIIVPV